MISLLKKSIVIPIVKSILYVKWYYGKIVCALSRNPFILALLGK